MRRCWWGIRAIQTLIRTARTGIVMGTRRMPIGTRTVIRTPMMMSPIVMSPTRTGIPIHTGISARLTSTLMMISTPTSPTRMLTAMRVHRCS